ncbi:hypothetical protein [Saccharothrix texasensis]|uniref:Uncharacterized protein n=1 Tax=Saccharothrix texasensis TaxID=103734 RepID=A0A3N1H469_9PSEU|nr:hypothetical protein [Saccharothrix texasensis]ROP37314.1 hypothetical protein EDD40_2619 [Saccharothrix texasensis]
MISWKNRVVKTMLATAPRMQGSWGVATAMRWDDRTTIVDGEYVKQSTSGPDDENLGGVARLVDTTSGLAFHVMPPWNAAKSTGYVLVPAVPRELERNYHPTHRDHQILVSFDMPSADVADLLNTRLPRYHNLIRQAREEKANGDRAMARAVEIITAVAAVIGAGEPTPVTARSPRRGTHGIEWFGAAGPLQVDAHTSGSLLTVSFSLPVKDFEDNTAALATVIRT